MSSRSLEISFSEQKKFNINDFFPETQLPFLCKTQLNIHIVDQRKLWDHVKKPVPTYIA